MKRLKYLTLLLVALTFGACDDEEQYSYEKTNNVNANSTAVCKYANRLEFPKLSANGSSKVLVNTTNDKYDADGVNYCVEWDTNKKSQRWSCYQMHSGFKTNTVYRYEGNPQYPWDTRLKAGVEVQDEDFYYGSGYDHGHICPSADRLYSKDANYQTFFMTNMQPQRNKFNAGLWSKLESQIRTWTSATGTEVLYVCKGATIDDENNIIGRINGQLIIPKYFFCALLMKNAQGYKAIGFWMENENVDRSSDKLSAYAVSVDQLERLTGIDFFCNLPDADEEDRESRCDLAAWGLK